MTREDWTLLAIAASEGKPLTPVQLQKSLFIFGQNLSNKVIGDFYEFIPYNYGPFDYHIYQDAESLAFEGMVDLVEAAGGRWSEYRITSIGSERAEEIKRGLTERVFEYLQAVVKWTQSLTFQELVRAIYEAYPDYKENSAFLY